MSVEEWLPVPGYEGQYEASSTGQVRSVRAHPKGRTPALHVLQPALHRNGYLNVGLRKEGVRKVIGVHRIVCAAFHGRPKPGKTEVCHADGDKTNNSADNLRWGSHSENVRDSVAAGTHFSLGRTKTHCKNGHEFTVENTRITERQGGRHRECRVCRRDIGRRYRARNTELGQAQEHIA
ncbi:NUMOD4 motif-containing HNH endonuclease [Microbacterium sp. NPDC090007]|uniref:NUMOD4 motif-containing HNH endonuclease n=1 Tax=Microbacterium sp. NPDC090007 TaxID=3364204 RepID=UPI003818D635